ncbi:hypothetical protein ZIOFF_054690 [Zingiber officinale]|uniref:poly(A)-specific ribonuclease n=1 Tax=Zingiber officinale TaxID=94328 RepID=A0A8J5FFB3_ZINOF|nr:hypothetical protein ZIOFF_054690 [Zingiber officinale]
MEVTAAVPVNGSMLISSASASASASRVEVRSVWAHNLDQEFALIRSALPFHPFVALDTEYPGVVLTSKNPYCTLTIPQRYDLIRANVDVLCIVQVGLTLSDTAGAYDFAFLVKMLTRGNKLPQTLHEFLGLVRFFFGGRVFDVKHLSKHCHGLYGGLERVASAVQVERALGCRHQSGSDSLLTWQVFFQIASRVNPELINRPEHIGTLFGLELIS